MCVLSLPTRLSFFPRTLGLVPAKCRRALLQGTLIQKKIQGIINAFAIPFDVLVGTNIIQWPDLPLQGDYTRRNVPMRGGWFGSVGGDKARKGDGS